MQNISASVNIIAPMLIYASAGFLLRRLNIVDKSVFTGINKISFWVLLPCLLFKSVYSADLDGIDPRLLAYSLSVLAVVYTVSFLVVTRAVRDDRDKGVIIQALFRGNTLIYGAVIVEGLVGAGTESANTLVVLGFLVIVYSFLGPTTLELFGEQRGSPLKTLKKVLTNPMVISGIIALLIVLLRVRLPAFVTMSVNNLGSCATPLALISLGASFDIKSARDDASRIFAVVFVRLLALPLLAVGVGALVFGFRGASIAALVSAFGTPTAVATYPIVQECGGNSKLAGEILAFTTLVSVLTLFLLILAVKALGWV